MAKYKYKLKKRGGRHGRGADPREHFGSKGKPKKRLTKQSAQSLAKRTGMNYYHCGTCGAYHVGRTNAQVEAGELVKDQRPLIVCPKCGAPSWNPHDLEEGYCGACCWWTSDPLLAPHQPAES